MRRRLGPIVAAVLFLTACAPAVEVDEAERASGDALEVLIGSGPHRQILQHAVDLSDGDLEVSMREAGDDADARLAAGEADAVYAEPLARFEGVVEDEGLVGLRAVARVHVVPYGLYSAECAALDEIPHFSTWLVPRGTVPTARSLHLLQHARLLTLNREFGGTELADLTVGPANIVDDARHLNLSEVDPEQFGETIGAVDGAVMTPDQAEDVGFTDEDLLVREPGPENPYANVLVTRSDDQSADLTALAHLLESAAVQDYIETEFEQRVIPARPSSPDPEIAAPDDVYEGSIEDYTETTSCSGD